MADLRRGCAGGGRVRGSGAIVRAAAGTGNRPAAGATTAAPSVSGAAFGYGSAACPGTASAADDDRTDP
ncbi:MAG: hypothetical protein E6H53_06480 [Betaproteobacteria bacterium]|nr:MAG: hypothetical protein E6H53_06480 [Betaproteobacteria bacterium]